MPLNTKEQVKHYIYLHICRNKDAQNFGEDSQVVMKWDDKIVELLYSMNPVQIAFAKSVLYEELGIIGE